MKKYNVVLGLIMATVLAIGILPTRLYQGQGNDPYNLIGSEIVIWAMCLASWLTTYYILLQVQLRRWQRIGFSLVICVLFSNLFYFMSNPFFEDYPLSPMLQSPLGVALLRLSLRGLLMGMIVVPVAFLVENERQQNQAELNAQKLRAQASEEQKRLLESLVAERTRTLENTLSSLRKSESELDNQVYVLSRLVASVTHDVSSPLNFVIIIAEQIDRFLRSGRTEKAAAYHQELLKALTGIAGFMNNLLEFTKTQVRSESIVLTDINVAALVNEKIQLFEGIINSQKIELIVRIDPGFTIHTNYNLLAIILHNLLDNATRYTGEGLISITTHYTETAKKLIIENTAKTDFVTDLKGPDGNEYSDPWEPGAYSEQNKGIGLILVRNISALLSIDFSMQVTSGKATAQLIFNDAVLSNG